MRYLNVLYYVPLILCSVPFSPSSLSLSSPLSSPSPLSFLVTITSVLILPLLIPPLVPLYPPPPFLLSSHLFLFFSSPPFFSPPLPSSPLLPCLCSPFHVRFEGDSDDDEYTDGDLADKTLQRSKRYLLSTSLDVDPRLPYRSELRGIPQGFSPRPGPVKGWSAEEHQTILVTSMLMGSGEGREGRVCEKYPYTV